MQSVNLMPTGYAAHQRSKRRLVIITGIMVAGVLAMVGFSRLMDRWMQEKEHSNVTLKRLAEDLQGSRAELAQYNRQLQNVYQRFAVVRTLDYNRRWASCLARIAAATGEDIVLTRTQVSPAVNPADEPQPAGGAPGSDPAQDFSKPERLVLKLEGYAMATTDVTRFMSALNATGLFDRVTFKGSEMARINLRPMSRFELECPIRYRPDKPTGDEPQPAAGEPPPENASREAPAVLHAAQETHPLDRPDRVPLPLGPDGLPLGAPPVAIPPVSGEPQ